MEYAVAVIVALIAAGASIATTVVSARATRNGVLMELSKQQAVQQERFEGWKRSTDERIENYKKSTDEKIDALRDSVAGQAAYGTRLALLEAWKDSVERKGEI